MENIEIRRQNKRSVESLIEQSAIDNEFNYEMHELKKAFNETILSLNSKNVDLEKQIEKYKIVVRELQEIKNKYQIKIKRLSQDLESQRIAINENQEIYAKTKKRLQYVEYKLQSMTQNRNLVQNQQQEYDNESNVQNKQKLKAQFYSDLSKIINKKVVQFTSEIKVMPMTKLLEQKIETFLEELVYLNPHSEYQVMIQNKVAERNANAGKIRKEHDVDLTDLDEWKKLQKSLEELRSASKNKVFQHQNQYNKEKGHTGNKDNTRIMTTAFSNGENQRSVSPNKRRILFKD